MFVFLDYFYALSGTERDLVVVLWDKVVSGINVFDHKNKLGGEMGVYAKVRRKNDELWDDTAMSKRGTMRKEGQSGDW